MKSKSTSTRKAASALVTLGAIVLMACTPMAALAHSVSAHGGGNNYKYPGALSALIGGLGL
jgi:hypothetical protein